MFFDLKKPIIVISSLLLFAVLVNSASRGDERSRMQKYKPLQGISLQSAHHKLVGYFESSTNVCKLTCLLAQESIDENFVQIDPIPVRFIQEIEQGNRSMLDINGGTSYEFSCSKGASELTVQTFNVIALSKETR